MSAALVESLLPSHSVPDLGPRVREGVWSVEEAEAKTAEVLGQLGVKGKSADCLRALVLLWHDHLDVAHGLVQDLGGADPALVHGLMHRREPDYSNARYWFNRVGAHAIYEPLADAVAAPLAAHAALPFRLIRDGRWDPFAFIDAVASVSRAPAGSTEVALLRELQAIESRVLAGHLAGV